MEHKTNCSCSYLYWSEFSLGASVRCWTCDPPQEGDKVRRGPGIGEEILTADSISVEIEKSLEKASLESWKPFLGPCVLSRIDDSRCPVAVGFVPAVIPHPPKHVPVIKPGDPEWVDRTIIDGTRAEYLRKVEAAKMAVDATGETAKMTGPRTPRRQAVPTETIPASHRSVTLDLSEIDWNNPAGP